jgi:hypothetical protein
LAYDAIKNRPLVHLNERFFIAFPHYTERFVPFSSRSSIASSS